MTLTPGTRFGGYMVLSPAGAGGMGEVYRARDQHLPRDVALKILPPALAGDRDHVARLEREAQLLASLSHPNIATLFGVERAGDAIGMVLEYVEGDTLAEHLKNGPLSIDHTRRIATQICAALAAAHDRGVVHRDLKPANIKVRPDGAVKVLDFGIAKAVGPDARDAAAMTVTATGAGVLIGTAAYMSPEQARGLAVDRRTDLWAFGCVLFEMLTGRRAFDGATTTDILAAVIGAEPDWAQLPPATPPGWQRLLRQCLEKDPLRRRRDAGDCALELEGPLAPAAEPRRPRGALVVVAALVAVLMGGWAAGRYWRMPAVVERPTMYYELAVPDAQRLADSRIALSADGRLLAYVAVGGTGRRLYVRDLSSNTTRELPLVEPSEPFFSPDGQSVAAFSTGSLHLVHLSSGRAEILCAMQAAFFGGAFTPDGTAIVFSVGGRLYRVAATGGTPVALEVPVDGRSLRYPQFLPDGSSLVFAAMELNLGTSPEIVFHDTSSRRSMTLGPGSDVRVQDDGSLVIVRDGALYHQPFDPLAPQPVSNGAARVVPTVAQTSAGGGVFAISGSQLVFATSLQTESRRLVRVDRAGNIAPLEVPPGTYQQARVSPDGNRVVFEDVTAVPHGVWMLDLTSNVVTKFITPGASHNPIWSSDGALITYQADRATPGMYQRRADGSSTEVLLAPYRQKKVFQATSWSADGRYMLGEEQFETDRNIVLFDRTTGTGLKPWLATADAETAAQISPDGKWVAYSSNASKRNEIYVRPLSRQLDGVWQVSTAGGDQPAWSRDGTELFYRDGAGMVAVPVKGADGTAFVAGRAQRLFEGQFYRRAVAGRDYDVFPDGKHFLMLLNLEHTAPAQFRVMTEWRNSLRRD